MRDWLDNKDDPRPAREQLDERYQFAGSSRPFNGFTMSERGVSIKFPGDPALRPVAAMQLRDELIPDDLPLRLGRDRAAQRFLRNREDGLRDDPGRVTTNEGIGCFSQASAVFPSALNGPGCEPSLSARWQFVLSAGTRQTLARGALL